WAKLAADFRWVCPSLLLFAALRGDGLDGSAYVAYCRTDKGETVSIGRDERQRRLPAGRKAQLAAYVADSGQVTVGELAERFGVSIDTVRRDLDQLAAEGILVRTYGGAVSLSTVSRTDRAVDQRLTVQEKEKEKIAGLAAALVQNGSTIMI